MKIGFGFNSIRQKTAPVTMMMPSSRTMCRLLPFTFTLLLGCIEHSIAMRGERVKRWDDPWLEKYVIVTPHVPVVSNGKGKGTPDSDDVGIEFPTISPEDTASGSTNPPVVSPTPSPVGETAKIPTPAPIASVTSVDVSYPTNVPTTPSPTSREQSAACKAAANGDVYATDEVITIRFLYELLSPNDRIVSDVASNVDAKVQDFLVNELVKCDNPSLLTIGGVGRGEIGNVVESICSRLTPGEAQVCHLMSGIVHVYLLAGGSSNDEELFILSDEEGLDEVEEKLRIGFNGETRRSLQESLVDEAAGILGLYYIGGRVDAADEGTTNSDGGDITGVVSGSRDTSSSSTGPAVVVPVVVAAVAALFVAFIVFRRRQRRSYEPSKGLLLDDDESSLGNQRWEEVKEAEESLKSKVLDTTDNSSSGSSGAAAIAAHEIVMSDLAGMTVSESLSDISFIKPVFIDPDSVTLYTNSPRVRYKERDYFVDDTINI